MRRWRSRPMARANRTHMRLEIRHERGRVANPPQVNNLAPKRRAPHISRIFGAVVAAIALCAGAAYGDRPHITKAAMAAYEKEFAGNILSATKTSTFTFVDPPRAYYVDNFGIVMASEISLVPGYGPTMFGALSKEQIQLHHRKVVERLPVLREQMKLAL